MYKVTGKQAFGGVYGLVRFHKGVGYVATKDAADILKAMGYTMEGEPEPPASPAAPPAADSLDGLTVAELKAHAAEKGIDLKDATKKADILAAIRAAEAVPDP